MFLLHAFGLNIRHTGEFCIDRPSGCGDCLLLVFKTNATLTLYGKTYLVSPNQAIIFSGDCPQLYGTVSGNYINHFLHFDYTKEEDLKDITFNKLLTPKYISEAEILLNLLSHEQLSVSKNRDAYISTQIKMILMKLSEESTKEKNEEALMKLSPHASILNELRATMYTSPAAFSGVLELAQKSNLSPSHFQQLYKTYFKVSCYEDLLTAKTKAAQYYLLNTTLQIKEIARLCGYENEKCFLHRFKQRTGLTPSQYRKKG